MNKALFVLVSCMASSAYCGGGGGEHKVHFKAEYPYHTIHKHHTERIPDVKIIKVPVVKEVKVLEPYKVPYKVKVPFLVKQQIHTVVKQHHSHPVHTSEHVHHKPSHGSSHGYEEISKSYGSHAASAIAPMYVSHSAVHSSHDAPSSSYRNSPSGFQPILSTKDSYPAYSHDFHSKLHTSVPMNFGFGSDEGRSMDKYEVKESADMGPVLFGRATKSLAAGKMTEVLMKAEAYPYKDEGLPQDDGKASEYLFGFDPKATSYDFTDL